jgi:HD-like signal output (HDOD) protein
MATAVSHDTAVDEWVAFWEKRPLPVLQSTKAAIAQFAGRAETARSDQIVALILRDPLLTATALRAVNQRERSGLVADVVAIENVVLLMGIDPMLALFNKLPTVESILLPKSPAAYVAFLREITIARLAAKLAREFANLRYDSKLEEIFVSALLANLPKQLRALEPGLGRVMPKVDLAMVSAPLFARWHFPDVFTALIHPDDGGAQRGMMQQSILRMAEHLQWGWWQKTVADDLHVIASTVGLDEAECWDRICRAMLHFANKDWPYAQVFPPARWLAMQPGEWPKPKPKVEAVAKPSFQDFVREIAKAGETGASFNQIMTLAVRAMSEGVGMTRIVFSLLMAGQNMLKSRYVIGANGDDPLRGLQVDLGAPHLVTKLMLKPQSIWLNAGNAGQYEALLPKSLRQAVGEGEFFAMSLFVEDKPVGLFYADDRGGVAMTEAKYQTFKQICLATGQSLTRQAKRLDLGGR